MAESGRTRGPPRVVIVDDQPMMRIALRTILDAHGIEVCGEAGDGEQAVAVVRTRDPDVVLMDVRMPGRDGIAATAELTVQAPSVRVIVLTTFDDDEVLFGALDAGASGFLLKNSRPEALVHAVYAVVAGDAVLDPAVTARVMRRAERPTGAPNVAQRLTDRELDVWWLIAQGFSNAEIAARLRVTEATVKTHVSRVLTKLGVRDRVQAVIAAYRNGLATTTRHVAPHRDQAHD